jgi:hypothetical protein
VLFGGEMVSIRIKLFNESTPRHLNLEMSQFTHTTWDQLKQLFCGTFHLDIHQELYCVLIDSTNEKVVSSIIKDAKKFWTIYDSKYCQDENYVFEINIRQADSAVATVPPSVTATPRPLVPTFGSEKSSLSQISIHQCCRDGNLDLVKELVRNGSHINARDATSSSPLHYAALNGHIDLVKYLVSEKAFKNNKNSLGQTPFLCAVQNGNIELVKYLLQERVFTFAVDNEGNSALHIAANNGHHDLLKWLVQNNVVDIAIKNHSGKTYQDLLSPQTPNPSVESQPDPTISTDRSVTSLPCRIEGFNYSVDIAISIATLTWENLCHSVLKTFDVISKESPTTDSSSLVDHAILLEEDGDEGSGRVNDLRKFMKVFTKIYKKDTGMIFLFHLNPAELKKRNLQTSNQPKKIQNHEEIVQELEADQGLCSSLLLIFCFPHCHRR